MCHSSWCPINRVRLPWVALPTFLSFPHSHAFRDGKPKMIWNSHSLQLKEPNIDEREQNMGSHIGVFGILGQVINFNYLTWIFSLCLVEWTHFAQFCPPNVAPLLWPSVGVKPNTWKSRELESSGTPECSELDSKRQNTLHWGVLGVIEKVLKRRYRKWSRIGHLDICNPRYGQKKGRESNWQFDSRPLKVMNRPLPDARIESAIRRWKDLDESYKFGSDLVSIRPASRELWAPKVPGLHPGQFRDNFGTISGLQLGSPGKKSHLDVVPKMWHREYYMGEGGGSLRVRAMVCLVVQSARGLSQHPRVFPNVN
jgi:hypothetical protein